LERWRAITVDGRVKVLCNNAERAVEHGADLLDINFSTVKMLVASIVVLD